jgi:hypothetical protein
MQSLPTFLDARKVGRETSAGNKELNTGNTGMRLKVRFLALILLFRPLSDILLGFIGEFSILMY